MSERTLAEPLSGHDVVERIVEEVRRRLKSDCFLNPVFAYPSFACDGSFRIWLKDPTGTRELMIQFQAASDTPLDEDAYLRESQFHIGEEPPNTVREQAGTGIPTEFKTPDGRTEVKRQIVGGKSRGRQMAGVPESAEGTNAP